MYIRNVKRERVENVIGAVLVVAFVTAIVVCQRSTGWWQLGAMLCSLLGLIGVLALYNRRFK